MRWYSTGGKRFYVIDVEGFPIDPRSHASGGNHPMSRAFSVLDRDDCHRDVQTFSPRGGRTVETCRMYAENLARELNAEYRNATSDGGHTIPPVVAARRAQNQGGRENVEAAERVHMSGQNTQENTGLKPPWKPGESGNPGGRPKGLAKRIREIAPPDKLADFYLAVFENETEKLGGMKVTLKDRIDAGNWLADRGYGKAASHAAIEDGDPLDIHAADAELNSLEDELARAREEKARRAAERTEMARTGTNGSGPA